MKHGIIQTELQSHSEAGRGGVLRRPCHGLDYPISEFGAIWKWCQCCIVILLGLPLTGWATTYYVATNGLDTYPGTITQPFLTISNAASVAAAGDTVEIRGGIYRETVVPANNGTTNAPITFEAYPNEVVTVSGADVIPAGAWQVYSNAIYQAPMSWDLGFSNQVFVDGLMMNEARFPNNGYDQSLPNYLTADAGTTNTPYVANQPQYGIIVDSSLTQSNGYWVGAVYHLVGANSGSRTYGMGDTCYVLSNSVGSLTFQLVEPSTKSEYLPAAGTRYYLTGKFEQLDAPGEWFCSSNTLYLYPPNQDVPGQHLVEAKRRLNGFDLTGSSFIVVRNISLFACTIITSLSSHDNLLDQLEVMYPSYYSWINSRYSTGVSDSGIVLNGTNNTLRMSSVAYSSGNGVSMNGLNNVLNNLIHDVAQTGNDCSAVTPSGIGGEVGSNTLFNASRSVLQIRKMQTGYLHHNQIWYGMLRSFDYGAIYSYGWDGLNTRIAYNRIHDMNPPCNATSWNHNIYLDTGTRNYMVDHNVVWDAGDSLFLDTAYGGEVTNIQVYNNTFADGQNASMGYNFPVSPHWDFRNNIFLNWNEVIYVDTFNPTSLQPYTNATFLSTLTNVANIFREQKTVVFFNLTNHDYRCSSSYVVGMGVPITVSNALGVLSITPPNDPTPDIGAYDSNMVWVAGAASISSGSIGAGWAYRDIGCDPTLSPPGHSAMIGQNFVVTGGGSDIGGTTDSFQMVSRNLAGDGSVQAELMFQDNNTLNVDGWSKAGVMLRASTNATDNFVMAGVTPGNGVFFEWRDTSSTNVSITNLTGIMAPVWLKVLRSGSNYTGSYKKNNGSWTTIGSATVNLATNVQAGLAVSSRNNQTLSTAIFSGVQTATALTPYFTNLTGSRNVGYGSTNSFTLSGQLLAAGPVYPAMGETISVTIRGTTQTTTVTNGTGGFAISLSPANIPAGAAPYPITYFYDGNAILNGAVNTSTTLTVNPIPLTLVANNQTKVVGQNSAFLGTEFTAIGLTNGDTVEAVTLFSPGATHAAGTGTYPIIASNATGADVGNYTITYSNGVLSVIAPRNLTWTTNAVGIVDGGGIWNEGSACLPAAAWYNGVSYGNVSLAGDNVTFGGGSAGVAGAITNDGSGVNPGNLTLTRPNGGGAYAFYGHPITLSGGMVAVISNNPSFYCPLNGSFTLVGSNQTAYLMTNGAQVASDWITINPGMTLQCGGNGGYGNAGGATMTNNGNLIWRRSGGQVVSNAIFGIGNVTYQLRNANFIFAAPQAYTGDTVLQPTGVNALGSTVRLDTTDRLPVTTDLIINSFSNAAITLDLNGNDQMVASLASDAASTLTSTMITNSSGTSASTLTLSGTNRQTFYNGQIAGNLGLTLNGTNSRFTLSNDCSYAGITLINAGCFALGAGASISNTPLIGIGGGATFDVSGVGGSYSLCAGQILTNAGTSTGILNGSLNSAVGALNLSYLAGTPSLLITNGTLTLSANTTVLVDNQGSALAVGSYKIIAAAASGAVAGSLPLVTVTGNGLNGVGASLQIVNNELYLTVIPSRNLRWTVSTNGITDGSGIWNEGAPCQPNAAWFDGFSYGNISFPGDSVQFGAGTGGAFGAITNGGISVNPTNLAIYRPWGGGNYAFYGAPIQMTGGNVTVVSNNPSFYCQVNGSFTLVGSNQTAYLMANGAQLASDAITINPGMTLQCGGNSGTGSPGAASITNNGTLIWRRSGTQIVSNAITGSGNVIYQLRSASFTFAAAQTYTGDTTIQPTGVNAGSSTVTLDVDDRLPTTTDLIMKSFAGATNTLDLNGNNQTLASLSSDAASTVASTILTNSAGTNLSILTLSGTNRVTFFNGLLSGNLGLTLNGAGSTLTLSNDCLHTGATLINAGCLALGLGASISNTPLIGIGNGAVWDVSSVGGSYGLGSGQILSNAAAATGVINGNLNPGSGAINVTYSSGIPALLITNGALTLSAGTGFQIFNVGPVLLTGSYKLMAATPNGMVAGNVPSVTVLGNGYSGLGVTLQITNNELYLVVAGSTPSPVTLTVTSLQGAPVPAGVTTNAYGTLINAYAPTTVNSTTQYVATGWTGTGSVGSGTGTNVSFNLTTNTTLIWRWQTNVWVNLNTLGN